MSNSGGSRTRGGSNSFGGGGGGDFAVKPYNSRTNNSYDDMGGEKPTKIVLLGASSDMHPDGIRKWCNQYGTVLNVRFTGSGESRKIFFVDYGSFAEAEKALRCINESNPFHVKCEFSRQKKDGTANRNDRDSNQRTGFGNQHNQQNDSRESRHDVGINSRYDKNEKNPNRQENGGDNSRSNYQNRSKPVVDNTISFEPKLTDKTNLAPNGQTNFLTNFKKISLSPPKWTNQNSDSSSNATKQTTDTKSTVITKNFKEPEPLPAVNNGVDSPAPSKKGSCINCNKESKFVCERCKCFYCSHECQTEDWPFHKSVCNELPRLMPVKINYTKGFKILDPPEAPTEIIIPPKKSVELSPPGFNKNVPPPKVEALKEQPPNVEPPKVQPKNSAVPDDHPNKVEIQKIENFVAERIEFDRKAPIPTGVACQINQFSKNLPKQIPIPEEPKPAALHIFGEFPKTRSPVVITAVISADVVYIRSSSGKQNASYCQLLQDVYSHSEQAKKLVQMPNKGDIVLADYQGTYNRALVLKPQSKQEIHIAYLDFGNVDIKRLDELKTINSELKEIPRYTFRINLKGVVKSSMPEDGLQYLNNLCDEITELEIRYDIVDVADKEKKCELYNPGASVMVNKRVNELMEIKPPTDDDKIVMIDDIQIRHMPPGKNVKVVVRDNSLVTVGCVSLATADCESDIKSLNAEVNRYCNSIKSTQSYTPRINEACLVYLQAEDMWVRALCIEAVGNGSPKMQLIDIGNFVEINIQYIRRIPAKLAKVPCCAIQAYLKKLPFPLNAKQVAKVTEFFPVNGVIVVDEVEVDDGSTEDEELNNVITINKLIEYFES